MFLDIPASESDISSSSSSSDILRLGPGVCSIVNVCFPIGDANGKKKQGLEKVKKPNVILNKHFKIFKYYKEGSISKQMNITVYSSS